MCEYFSLILKILKQDTLDFNGFCDNGDAKIFNKNHDHSHAEKLPSTELPDLTTHSNAATTSQNPDMNSADLELRVLRLFQIILDFVYEILTQDDFKHLPSELKIEYFNFNRV